MSCLVSDSVEDVVVSAWMPEPFRWPQMCPAACLLLVRRHNASNISQIQKRKKYWVSGRHTFCSHCWFELYGKYCISMETCFSYFACVQYMNFFGLYIPKNSLRIFVFPVKFLVFLHQGTSSYFQYVTSILYIPHLPSFNKPPTWQTY